MTEEEQAKMKADLEALQASHDKLKAENEALKASAAKQKTASEVAAAMQKRIDEAERERDLAKAEVIDLKKTITQLLNGGNAKKPDREGFMKSLNL